MHKFVLFFLVALFCLGCKNGQKNDTTSIATSKTNEPENIENSPSTQDNHIANKEEKSSNSEQQKSVVDLSFENDSTNDVDKTHELKDKLPSAISEVPEINLAEEAEINLAEETEKNSNELGAEAHYQEQETEENFQKEDRTTVDAETEENIEENSNKKSEETSFEEFEETSFEESNSNAEVDTTSENAAKAEKDRLAREAQMKAQKDRLAREAQMKAEKDRLAREAQMKAQKDRLAREAQMKAEKEKKRYWNLLLAKKGTYYYDIYIDKTKRGTQVTSISANNGSIVVKLDVSIDVSTWYYSYKFKQTSTEVWRDDIPQSYDCFQDDNGTKTTLKLKKTSSSGYSMTFKGKTTSLSHPVIPGSSWNLMDAYEKYPNFVVIDGGQGTTVKHSKSKIKFHNDEKIKVGSGYIKCKHFSPTTGEKWSAWYSTNDGSFVRYTDVVDGYFYDTVLTKIQK
ncbi:DUF6134 family protein [Candidatus Uabimicrobium sp. HlEnr_7]|uniref:DUF6134 family protein n=1 Tax=Candidatus Uabimicrobium helgolandensis TaxID=3095367 RepID=UPI003556AD7A